MDEEKTPSIWTPEKRLLQSRIMRRRLKEAPWTPEQNQARSVALRGRKKTLEMRAKMYASRKLGPERTPEWDALYQDRLRQLREERHWEAVEERAKELNLEPEDVKFAVELAFAPPAD